MSTATRQVMSDILSRELEALRTATGRPQLDMIETGCIRNDAEAHRVGDGWSTLAMAAHVRDHGGSMTSIDLNTEAAARVLDREGLASHASLLTGDSVTMLNKLRREGRTFDFVLLDSADDPYLIFKEYEVAIQLVRPTGLIAVDDVSLHEDSYGSKGEVVVPHLRENGVDFRVERRWGGYGLIDVVLIDIR